MAVNKGIPVKLGEMADLSFKTGGTLANPILRTELKEVAGDAVKEMQQLAVDFAKAKLDKAKQTIKDSLTGVKNQVLK
ncbi:MAG: hypothetical protein IPN29_09625 [Saprospiraceae bacterium]|nr:hypothetical protein [Saprospiraceae bacterium]